MKNFEYKIGLAWVWIAIVVGIGDYVIGRPNVFVDVMLCSIAASIWAAAGTILSRLK